MKEFLKWLGINEKIAKIAVWLFIFMVSLIIINVFLESIGFPYYRITAENLSKINYGVVIEFILGCLLNLFNFYATILLVVKVKDFKKTIKYAILYLTLNIIVVNIFDYALSQIFIIIFIIGYCYFYGHKNWKYIIYGTIAFIVNAIVQSVCYLYKIRFVNYDAIGLINRFLTSLDYFIVMILVIIIKEIYLKKRGENNAKINN